MAYPPVTGDLGVTAGRYGAALKQANDKLEAVAACDAKVRGVFAGTK